MAGVVADRMELLLYLPFAQMNVCCGTVFDLEANFERTPIIKP